ncbi:hypothetical protein EYZ11_006545 [Aspergillus tanneri]|uniref:Uncharacterized protein n=1 Tax=Aspergillus tanneri TaxID=1220188 RepID=A0A4S3JHM6_9EURO|nr:hypothetical protein EYZ11_006545 [Aspergillus tanneri]
MGGSPHLNERQHVPQAQSQLGSQYPVAAARENGRAASSHDFYNTVERNIIPATHHPVSPLDARTETEPANSSHKNHSETTSSASSIVLVPQSQELDSSNCTTAQRGSLLQPPMQPESTGASNLGKIDEKTVALNPDTQNDTPGSESPSKLLLGQKRTATGVVKPAANPQDPHYLDQNGTERRRSRSIGSVSRGSRIAAVNDTIV